MRKPETVRREQRAWALACDGVSMPDIAARLVSEGLAPTMSRQAVWKMLHRVQADILAEMRARGEREKAAQHERLMRLWREAMDAWEGSKKGPKGPDPRFLDAATRAAVEVGKLWGVNAPVRADLTLSVYQEADESPWSGATAEELEALRALRRHITQRAEGQADEPEGGDGGGRRAVG